MINPPSRTDEIIARAIELAEDRGIAGVTTAALARRLGFTEAALYRYFPGKGAILAAALEQLGEQLFASATLELVPGGAASGAELETQLRRHVSRFSHRQGLLLELLLWAASGREGSVKDAANAFVQEYAQRIASYFEQAQMAGAIAPTMHAEELSRLWVCQLFGGFIRCRIARDPWSPVEQPGFNSFVRALHRQAAMPEPVGV